MTPDHYYLQLGRLVGNLQSLEFELRAMLYAVNPPPPGDPSLSMQLHELKVGQTVPENLLTDYRTLTELIARYNKLVETHDSSLCVNTELVALRDALAHGRLAIPEPAPDMMILKFGPVRDGRVAVMYAATMTESWFKEQINLVHREAMKVYKAGQLLVSDPKAFPDKAPPSPQAT